MAFNTTSPTDPTEQQLVQRAISGDSEAFGALYTLYLDSIYRYVYFRVGDAHESEDLTEEIFVKAWEALPEYQVRQYPFKSWLYLIAHNLTVDYYRMHKPLPLAALDLNDSGALLRATEDAVEREEILKTLAAGILRLTEEEQQIIILRFVEGLSHQEVAGIIGKSVEACRVFLHRALIKLDGNLKG